LYLTIKLDYAANPLFTQIPLTITKISKVDRSPLVGNLGSPATLILERPSWDAGKQTIRKAEIATVIVDALFVVVVLMTRAKVNKGVENIKRSSVCPPDLGMTRRILKLRVRGKSRRGIRPWRSSQPRHCTAMAGVWERRSCSPETLGPCAHCSSTLRNGLSAAAVAASCMVAISCIDWLIGAGANNTLRDPEFSRNGTYAGAELLETPEFRRTSTKHLASTAFHFSSTSASCGADLSCFPLVSCIHCCCSKRGGKGSAVWPVAIATSRRVQTFVYTGSRTKSTFLRHNFLNHLDIPILILSTLYLDPGDQRPAFRHILGLVREHWCRQEIDCVVMLLLT
jgi:hypothetical protein